MSFGYSIGDGILLVQLAWRTVQGARQACGEHDELTREVSSLHRVLQQLHRELSNPESLLNRADNKQREEMEELCEGCQQILNVMNAIVTKYNTLSDDERSGKRIWQKVKFGNGEMKDLAEIRLKMLAHTSALIMGLNLCSLGSQGKVEKQLEGVGGDLEGIRAKVDWIVANITAKSEDGTVWTSYTNDDKTFWRELRRELVKEGYHSSVLRKHKWLLKSYVEELGMRGVFDNLVDEEVLAESADEGEESNILIQDVHSTSAADLEDADSDDPDSGNADLEDKSSKDSPSEEVQAEEASSECASTGNLESRDSSDNETVRPYLETKNYTKSTSHAAKQEQPPQATSQKNSSCAVAAMPAQVEKLPDKESAPSSHSNDLDSKLDERGIQKAELNRGSPPLHTASAKASQPPNYFRKVPVSIPQKPQIAVIWSKHCCCSGIPASEIFQLDCGCRICRNCLERIFEWAVDGRFTLPLCCMKFPISLKYVEKVFDLEFKKRWNRKVYNKISFPCPNRRCDLWLIPNCIPKGQIWKPAKCPYCGTRAEGSSQFVIETFKLK